MLGAERREKLIKSMLGLNILLGKASDALQRRLVFQNHYNELPRNYLNYT
jgi:hypothetical protein